MNKADLIELVAKQTEVSKAQAERSVNAIFDGISGSLKKGKGVQLIGFGTWNVKKRNARKGRNPATGATINIKAKKVVSFKAGQALKKAVN